jgi:hypothetical protein
MNISKFFIFILYFCPLLTSAQEILYGTKKYVEYHKGNLPIVISVPHDGSLTPDSIPDRVCNSPTIARDINTIDIAKMTRDSLFSLTGCYPHIIICNLKRTKIDCNRSIEDGACDNGEAKIAWIEFQTFIDTAQQSMLRKYGNKILYIDLHAHGHDSQRIELGYLLTAADYNRSDSVLNTANYIAKSSISNLVSNNFKKLSHAKLLRDSFAFGTMLGNYKYPSVPSMQIKTPDTFPYFNGGYNTVQNTCAGGKKIINGFQIELNYKNLRENITQRGNFSKTLSLVILDYLKKHFDFTPSLCKSIVNSIQVYEQNQGVSIYPQPIKETQLNFMNLDTEKQYTYSISDIIGRRVVEGSVLNNQVQLPTSLYKGTYFITVSYHQIPIYKNKIIVDID